MYVTRVTLNNIRGFEHLDFDLSRGDGRFAGWTVFTGGNGSGKSTLLKSIAMGILGSDVAEVLQPGLIHWIREGIDPQEASVDIKIIGAADDEKDGLLIPTGLFLRKPFKYVGDQPFPVRLEELDEVKGVIDKLSNGIPMDIAMSGLSHGAANYYSYLSSNIYLHLKSCRGFFSCGYGPFRRVSGASPDVTSHMSDPNTGRFVTMFQESASLSEVDQWLRTLSHKKLEGKQAEAQQLDLVLDILRDDLLPNGLTIDRVDSDGLWLKDRNGVQLTWGDMSDGYRSAVALLADILRHMINTYGIEGLAETRDGKTVITRSGVVLIDEVDAHLHPEWQRKIGFWLKERFPAIQFLVTTHSPIICQAADENGLFVLPNPGSDDPPRALSVEEYNKVIASRPDTILTSAAFGLQNTRSPRAVDARAEWSKLNRKKKATTLTEEEEQRLQALAPLANSGEEP